VRLLLPKRGLRDLVGFLLLAVSAALLAAGAELFAEHAPAASRRLGVTALAVGLILAGAEPEELVTAIFASAQHHPGIAAGDAVGANVTMLTIVLGLAALFRPLGSTSRVRSYAFVASAAGLGAALALLDAGVSRAEGTVLVAVYAAIVALIWWRERQPPAFGELAEVEESESRRRGGRAVLLMLGGLVLMVAGGRLAVAGAERIVASLGLHESVVGLTFVALATTAELFALVWAAARRGVEELALAGVLGSAIYNSTVTLGVSALVRPLSVTGISGQAWLAAALPAAFALWGLAFKRVGRVAGVLLIGCYAGYLAWTFAAGAIHAHA
jgi:cation:H+ antiporter